jgi:hypothetical protein
MRTIVHHKLAPVNRKVSRRSALKALGTTVAALGVPAAPAAAPRLNQSPLSSEEVEVLGAIAEVVLPRELGVDGRRDAVAGFVRWIENYKEGADTDHGYGVTRIRRTGSSPAAGYRTQIAALQTTAAGRFPALRVADRQPIVEAALTAARIDRLPGRPNGAHIAADLMAFYFNSPAAADLCYRAAIGRANCRGLAKSDTPPEPIR